MIKLKKTARQVIVTINGKEKRCDDLSSAFAEIRTALKKGETCVMCGKDLPTESGKQYCKECEEKENRK